MATTDSITVREEHVETDTRLHRAVIVHTGDPPVRDLPLEREDIKHSSLSSEDIHKTFREMVEDAEVKISVYQPDVFESPIHEGLLRLSHFLVILSVPTEDGTSTTEAEGALRTATDEIRHSWSKNSQLGFKVGVMKFRQKNILPLLEEVSDQWATN